VTVFIPPNIMWVDQRGGLTREALAVLSSITNAAPTQWVADTLTASDALYYTVPADKTGEITAASAVNTSAGDILINVNIVPASASPSASNLVVSNLVVSVGGSVSLSSLVGQAVPPGASIYANSDTVAACVLTISGIERAQ
jgi:hypothetical protein